MALRPSAQTAAKTGRMKLGTQNQSSNEILPILAALGVNHICGEIPSAKFDEAWSVEGLTKLRERIETFGVTLEAVPLPLSSSYITKSENPGIMLGKSPERDREIDNICRMIENCAKAGIPMVKYNLTILGVVRSQPTRGPRRRKVQHIQICEYAARAGAYRSRSGIGGNDVGAHYIFPEARCAGSGAEQSEDGMPSA